MLSINAVEAGYGKIQILWGISLRVDKNEIVSLIGPNGAGKTTTLKAIMGIVKTTAGEITFEGNNLKGLRPYDIARLGISIVPEGREIFPRMSVYENLLVAGDRLDRRGLGEALERIYALFPVLKERKDQKAATLSGGEQQMLAIARALVTNPKMLLLDEPSAGLGPIVARRIFKTIEDLRNEGLTILCVEQNVHAALKISDRGYVLEGGRISLEGTAQELLASEKVRSSYLGM